MMTYLFLAFAAFLTLSTVAMPKDDEEKSVPLHQAAAQGTSLAETCVKLNKDMSAALKGHDVYVPVESSDAASNAIRDSHIGRLVHKQVDGHHYIYLNGLFSAPLFFQLVKKLGGRARDYKVMKDGKLEPYLPLKKLVNGRLALFALQERAACEKAEEDVKERRLKDARTEVAHLLLASFEEFVSEKEPVLQSYKAFISTCKDGLFKGDANKVYKKYTEVVGNLIGEKRAKTELAHEIAKQGFDQGAYCFLAHQTTCSAEFKRWFEKKYPRWHASLEACGEDYKTFLGIALAQAIPLDHRVSGRDIAFMQLINRSYEENYIFAWRTFGESFLDAFMRAR